VKASEFTVDFAITPYWYESVPAINNWIQNVSQGYVDRIAGVVERLQLEGFEDSIREWPKNVGGVERRVEDFKHKFAADAVEEEKWLLSNGVEADKAKETVTNHLFGRIVSFVALVLNNEYTIYDTFSSNWEQAIAKLEAYEKYSFGVGPKPDFDVIDLFGDAQIAITKTQQDYQRISETFYPALENKPNLHIPFNLITPFLDQNQAKLLDWIETVLRELSNGITESLKKLNRNDEAAAYQPVVLGAVDFRRSPPNFNDFYLGIFQTKRQAEIDAAVASGVAYHKALETAENNFSDLVVAFVKFVIEEEFKAYDFFPQVFADAHSKVVEFEAYAAGGPKPAFDVQEIHMAIYNAYSTLNQKFSEIQLKITDKFAF
jgi:hypothetical protein